MVTEEGDGQISFPGVDLEKRSGEGDVDSRIQVEAWRKMEAAALNRAGYREEWLVACAPPLPHSLSHILVLIDGRFLLMMLGRNNYSARNT